jgi:hypothetical protein
MNHRASSIGDLAVGVLKRERTGTVTRVFRRSAYLRAGDDFILVLWGGLRSPLTVNVRGTVEQGWKVGEKCDLGPPGIALGSGMVEVRGAEVYRSLLQERRSIQLPGAPALIRGVTMLRSFYEASPAGPILVTDRALRQFVERTLSPFAAGKRSLQSPDRYFPLIGRGGGFTPAGDDFVGGLLSTYNYIARCERAREVSVPLRSLRSRTVPESAAFLSYAIRGYVDEGLGSLILKTLGAGGRFSDELVSVVQRGHTSGIDMSLGVLLVEAALSDLRGEEGALEGCIGALWHR